MENSFGARSTFEVQGRSYQIHRLDSLAAQHDLNTRLEFRRNRERYGFLRWGQRAFDNFKVVTYPSLQPNRHGSAATAVSGR